MEEIRDSVLLKGIISEDFVNYRKVCMTLEFPVCDFKCCRECGKSICQNLPIVDYPDIKIRVSDIIERYLNNDITESLCFQGLEPLDSFDECVSLIKSLRCSNNPKRDDDVVIYTGYTEDEVRVKGYYDILKEYSNGKNIILKVGRFIPDQPSRYDDVLGVILQSDNQYGLMVERFR